MTHKVKAWITRSMPGDNRSGSGKLRYVRFGLCALLVLFALDSTVDSSGYEASGLEVVRQIPGEYSSVLVEDSVAYLGGDRITRVDLGAPTEQAVSTILIPGGGETANIVLHNDVLYSSLSSFSQPDLRGLLFEVSVAGGEPGTLYRASNTTLIDEIHGAHGDRLFYGCGHYWDAENFYKTSGMGAIDISTPRRLRVLASQIPNRPCYRLLVDPAGELIGVGYEVPRGAFIVRVDASRSWQLREAGNRLYLGDIGGEPHLASERDELYFVSRSRIDIIDVADRETPALIESIELPLDLSQDSNASVLDVGMMRDQLVVLVGGRLERQSSDWSGVYVLELSNSNEAIVLGSYHSEGVSDLDIDGNWIYVSDSEEGLLVFRPVDSVPTPTLTAAATSAPTPSSTTQPTMRSVTPSSSPTRTAIPTPTPAPSPSQTSVATSELAWPKEVVLNRIRILLDSYYDGSAGDVVSDDDLAPEFEAHKTRSLTDPDRLWQARAQRAKISVDGFSTDCHANRGALALINCSGERIASALNLPYGGGLTLFEFTQGADELALAMLATAGQYALYHAFLRDFDAVELGEYEVAAGDDPRDFKRYHERMIQAYERHMRSILAGMLIEARGDASFQASLTRLAGWLLTDYTRTLQALEEFDAWGSDGDRSEAIEIVNALNQRVWWEWVIPQPDGPRTAGKAELGSQATFDEAVQQQAGLRGSDQFEHLGRLHPSLRPRRLAEAPHDGLWFDADYTVPGEWYCQRHFHPAGGRDWQRCMRLAREESLGGSRSPFGHYFGRDASCRDRAGRWTRVDCGETNLGSMAEEWLGTYVGARAGLRLIEHLRRGGDPDTPIGALPLGAYQTVTERLGYGVAGFHGGEGRQDDMEWTFEQPEGQVRAIRTLSGAIHDGERQNGRYSLGETDGVPGRSSGNDGDTWDDGMDEYPGAMENHVPGPSPLYAAVIAQQVLSDKVDGGMSPSLYDAVHRNHPDEFESWVWLLQSSMYRCRDVEDPADPSCFAFSKDHWPYPATINREPLFVDPRDTTVPEPLRYLWRDAPGVVDSELIGESEAGEGGGWCKPSRGLAFGRVSVFRGGGEGYLVTEGGFGSYNLILQSAGAFMRLAAARSAEAAPSPDMEAAWRLQREEVLVPWYQEMERLVLDILELYGEDGLGYIPDAENVPCIAGEGSVLAPMTHRGSGRMSVESTIAWRARWYSAATLWYWWYDSEWLDIDDRWLQGMP